jgi:hypothetical protein
MSRKDEHHRILVVVIGQNKFRIEWLRIDGQLFITKLLPTVE